MSYDPNKYAPDPTLKPKWKAVDLDKTLAENVWPDLGIGAPIPEGIHYCRQATELGFRVVIHTSRPWWDYENIERWLNDHEVPFKAIVCGKLWADEYVDDRAHKPSWVIRREQQEDDRPL